MDNALRHAEAMIAEGADILDVGGESTRPGHTPVSAEEEAARGLPVIEALNNHFDVPISVDTFKASVAEVSLQAGADLVNDVWGLKYDPQMASVIAKYNAACCLMHNKEKAEYNNFLVDMLAETQECVNIARRAGISDEKIILDPGIGFGKTYEMNLETINHLELFQHDVDIGAFLNDMVPMFRGRFIKVGVKRFLQFIDFFRQFFVYLMVIAVVVHDCNQARVKLHGIS